MACPASEQETVGFTKSIRVRACHCACPVRDPPKPEAAHWPQNLEPFVQLEETAVKRVAMPANRRFAAVGWRHNYPQGCRKRYFLRGDAPSRASTPTKNPPTRVPSHGRGHSNPQPPSQCGHAESPRATTRAPTTPQAREPTISESAASVGNLQHMDIS